MAGSPVQPDAQAVLWLNGQFNRVQTCLFLYCTRHTAIAAPTKISRTGDVFLSRISVGVNSATEREIWNKEQRNTNFSSTVFVHQRQISFLQWYLPLLIVDAIADLDCSPFLLLLGPCSFWIHPILLLLLVLCLYQMNLLSLHEVLLIH